MSKSKMDKMNKKIARSMPIAQVATGEETAWDFNIGEHLKGKIKEGDVVVVEVPARRADGRSSLVLKTGRVVALKPSSDHNPANVHDVVDKVRLNRYIEERERQEKASALYIAACERAGELYELQGLAEAAEELEDDELAEMVGELQKLAGVKQKLAPSASGEALSDEDIDF